MNGEAKGKQAHGRRTSPKQDKTQQQQTDHQNDFCAGKPEFSLSIESDRQEIKGDDDHEHDGHPHGNVDVVGPVVDDQTSRGDFVGDQDSKGVPVQVAERKTHGSRNVSVTVVGHGTTVDREVRGDLSDGGDHAVHQARHEDVGSQDESRTTQGEGCTRTDEQTGEEKY